MERVDNTQGQAMCAERWKRKELKRNARNQNTVREMKDASYQKSMPRHSIFKLQKIKDKT